MTSVTNLNRYQRRKEKTRQELLAAAKKILAKKGYYNTKITDIAAEADIGVGTFYLYYSTKDALFFELVFFRFAQDNRELFKIVFGHGNTFNDLLRQVYATFIADAAANVTEGIRQQVFRPFHPDVVANALIGMSAQVVSWWIEQEGLSAAEMAEAMTTFSLHGLALHPPQHT